MQSFLQRSVPIPKRVSDLAAKAQALQERSYPSDSALTSAAVPVLTQAFELANLIQNQDNASGQLKEVMDVIQGVLDFTQAETDVEQEFPLDMDQAGLAKLSISRVLGQNVSLLHQLRRGFMRSVTGQNSLNSFVNRVTTEELQKRLRSGPEAFMKPPFVPPHASGVARFDSAMAGVGMRIPLSGLGVNPGSSLVTGPGGRALYEARCSVTSVEDIRPAGITAIDGVVITVGAKQHVDETWRLPALSIHVLTDVAQSLYADDLEHPAPVEDQPAVAAGKEITGLFPSLPRAITSCAATHRVYVAADRRVFEFLLDKSGATPDLALQRVFATKENVVAVAVTGCGRRLFASAGTELLFWDLDDIPADAKGETLSHKDLEARFPRGLQTNNWAASCIMDAGVQATGAWSCDTDVAVVAALANERVAVSLPTWRAVALLEPAPVGTPAISRTGPEQSPPKKSRGALAADAASEVSVPTLSADHVPLPQAYTARLLVGHTAAATAIAQSPQRDDYFTTGSADGVVRCWSASQHAPLLVFRAHAGAVTSILYPGVPDNFLLFTAGRDEGIKLFDLRRSVRCCVYELATGNNNPIGLAWDYSTATLVAATERALNRSLSQLGGAHDEFDALRLLQGETETEQSDVETRRVRRGVIKQDEDEQETEKAARVPWPDQAFHQPTQFQLPWDARGNRLNAYRFALRPGADQIEVPEGLEDAVNEFREMRKTAMQD